MTKMEERVQFLLNSHLEKEKKYVNERLSGIFIFGFICGVIISYSGFLGYSFGVGTGVALSQYYSRYTGRVTKKIILLFNHFMDRVVEKKM